MERRWAAVNELYARIYKHSIVTIERGLLDLGGAQQVPGRFRAAVTDLKQMDSAVSFSRAVLGLPPCRDSDVGAAVVTHTGESVAIFVPDPTKLQAAVKAMQLMVHPDRLGTRAAPAPVTAPPEVQRAAKVLSCLMKKAAWILSKGPTSGSNAPNTGAQRWTGRSGPCPSSEG